ncbi:MAG: hypothetical protein ACOYBP_09020 [Microbacteriaceae bacterium]
MPIPPAQQAADFVRQFEANQQKVYTEAVAKFRADHPGYPHPIRATLGEDHLVGCIVVYRDDPTDRTPLASYVERWRGGEVIEFEEVERTSGRS